MTHQVLYRHVRDLVREEWERLLQQEAAADRMPRPHGKPPTTRDTLAARTGDSSPALDDPHDCPLLPLLPGLMPLIDELHDRPVEQLLPMIRQMLLERDFVDENGDSVITPAFGGADGGHEALIERQVRVLGRVLDALRRDAFERGEWSDAPVTPIMFG